MDSSARYYIRSHDLEWYRENSRELAQGAKDDFTSRNSFSGKVSVDIVSCLSAIQSLSEHKYAMNLLLQELIDDLSIQE